MIHRFSTAEQDRFGLNRLPQPQRGDRSVNPALLDLRARFTFLLEAKCFDRTRSCSRKWNPAWLMPAHPRPIRQDAAETPRRTRRHPAPGRGRVRGLGGRRGRHRHRAGPGGEPRRLRGPARRAAGAGAHAEGGPGQDLRAGAGRAVPAVHRRGAQAAPGAGGRLPGDGGLARLPQVAAAAAARGGRRGPAERRGAGDAPGVPAQAAGGHAQRRGRADDAQAARTRHFRARHAGGHAHHPRAAVYRRDLRFAQGLRRAAPAHHQARARRAPAHGVVDQGGAPAARGADRRVDGRVAAAVEILRAVPGQRPRSPRRRWRARSGRRWRWRARAWSRSRRRSRSRPSMCASARKGPSWQPIG